MPSRRPETHRPLLLSALLLVVAIFLVEAHSCTTIENAGPPMPDMAGYPAFLKLARKEMSLVEDVPNRTFLVVRISDILVQEGSFAAAREELALAVADVRQLPAGTRYGPLMSLGEAMISEGFRQDGVELIKAAFSEILDMGDGSGRNQALAELVRVCIRETGALGGVLADAVDYVYIIPDHALRLRMLSDIAFSYQERNSRGSVSVLAQQAIIAWEGIGNPWEKAEAASRIALIWKNEGELPSAEAWVDRAFATLGQFKGDPSMEEDNRLFLETLMRLTEFGRLRDIANEAARLRGTEEGIQVQMAVIGAYLRQGSQGNLQARLAIQRLLNDVSRGGDSAEGMSRIARVMVRIAELQAEAGARDEALRYADGAAGYLQLHALGAVDGLRNRLALVYRGAGEPDKAIGQVQLMTDAYTGSLTCRELMGPDLDAGTLSMLVEEARVRADAGAILRDSLYAGLVSQSARYGMFPRTMSLVEQIRDPYTLAGLLMDVHLVLGGSESPEVAGMLSRLEEGLYGARNRKGDSGKGISQ